MIAARLTAGALMVLSMSLIVKAQSDAVIPADASPQYSQKISGDSTGWPAESSYLTGRVVMAAGAGIIIGILSCVCCFCFNCVNLCAKCCECIKKICGCCGAADPDEEGYTLKDRLILVAILTLAFVAVCVGCGVGFAGNKEVKDGVDEMSQTLTKLADSVYDQVKMGYDAGKLVGADVEESTVTDAEKMQTDIKDLVKLIEDNDAMRVLCVYIFYSLMMAIPLLGYISWFCGVATWSYFLTQFTFLMLFIGWMLFGVTLGMGVILDDLCVEAGNRVYGQTSELTDLFCEDSASSQPSYNDAWEKLEDFQETYSIEHPSKTQIKETDYGFTTDTYSLVAGATNAPQYTRNTALLLGMYKEFDTSRSTCEPLRNPLKVELCYVPMITESNYEGLCTKSGTEPDSVRCLQQKQIQSAAAMAGVSYLISCAYLDGIAIDLNNKVCDGMVGGLIKVTAGQGIVGFFYFLVLAVGCVGMNRFNNENYAENKEQQIIVQTNDSATVHPEPPAEPKSEAAPDPPSAEPKSEETPGPPIPGPAQNVVLPPIGIV